METRGIRRWIKAVIITLAMSLLFIPAVKVHAASASGECGENLTWSLSDDGTVLTISGRGKMTDYSGSAYSGAVIPPWSTHMYEAGNSRIKQVILPEGITSIGDCAFEKCNSLSIINIPDSVISLGSNAFTCCVSLNSIQIPDSVEIIESYAFSECNNLDNITIPILIYT
jgi:hypothetical protein